MSLPLETSVDGRSEFCREENSAEKKKRINTFFFFLSLMYPSFYRVIDSGESANFDTLHEPTSAPLAL